MEASPFIPPQNSQLAEIETLNQETEEQTDEPEDHIEVLDAVHQGYKAIRVVIGGKDAGLAFTREHIGPQDTDWTYYVHFDGLEESGKCFGEVDIRATDQTFNIYGVGIREDLKESEARLAEELMIGSLILLPCVIRKNFPEAQNFGDFFEDD